MQYFRKVIILINKELKANIHVGEGIVIFKTAHSY